MRMLQPTLIRLLGVNSVVCGLEVATSLSQAFLPPLILKAGFSEAKMTVLLGIGPLLALLIVPYLGRLSDKCQSSWGKRRPFILGLGVVLILSLILVPVGQMIIDEMNYFVIIGQLLLLTGTILLTFATQAAFNPSESLVTDMLQHSNFGESDNGFKVYSAMISLGGCLGFWVTSTKWDKYGPLTQEQLSFIIVLALFVLSLLVTMLSANESTTMQFQLLQCNEEDEDDVFDLKVKDVELDPGYETENSIGESQMMQIRPIESTHSSKCGNILITVTDKMKKCLFLPMTVAQTFARMPLVLRRLFWSDLFSWTAILCHALFYTDFIAQAIFQGSPQANYDSESRILYDAGVLQGSYGLFIKSITSLVYAAVVHERMVYCFGARVTYLLALTSFPVAMCGILLTTDTIAMNIFSAISGIAFAEVTTTPNTLVTLYHSDSSFFAYDGDTSVRGVGADVAILDAAFFIAQILLSVCVGALVELAGYSQVYIIVALVSGVLSAICAWWVVFSVKQLPKTNSRNMVSKEHQSVLLSGEEKM